jgi:antitoxin component YwqK of YwqJK toxin-antitoxin module
MVLRLFYCLIAIVFFSCVDNNHKSTSTKEDTGNNLATRKDTVKSGFTLSIPKDTVVNGEEVKRYVNGAIQMRGMRKDSKRIGVWKSWYEDGTPWSETTFKDGKKNGKTTTWYENGKKRYEGFFTNDEESGTWVIYDENGVLIKQQHYKSK